MRLDSTLESLKARLPIRASGSTKPASRAASGGSGPDGSEGVPRSRGAGHALNRFRGGRSAQVKVPGFLSETVRDLREQGLLPVVVILLIALPVAAIAFGSTGSSYEAPSASASASEGLADSSESLVVVADRPGLRDPFDRFRGRAPRDPFRALGPAGGSGLLGPGGGDSSSSAGSEGSGGESPTTGSASGSGQGISGPSGASLDASAGSTTGSAGSTGSSGSSGSSGTTASPSPSAPATSGGGGTTTVTEVETRYVLTHVQARLRFGQAGSGDLREIGNLPRLSGLPVKRPVVTYLGASMRHDAALFSVSPDVAGMAGEGQCPSGNALRCHYLLLRPGEALNLYDATRDVIWRLAMPAIEVIESEVDLIDEIIAGRSAGGGLGEGGEKDPREQPISSD